MDEIKKPELRDPAFYRESYDYRNIENAGHYRGIGSAGKVGSKASSSIDAMPPEKKHLAVPRDHKG